MSEVTIILHALEQGDPVAVGELLPLVYEELRRLMASRMANEAAGASSRPARGSSPTAPPQATG